MLSFHKSERRYVIDAIYPQISKLTSAWKKWFASCLDAFHTQKDKSQLHFMNSKVCTSFQNRFYAWNGVEADSKFLLMQCNWLKPFCAFKIILSWNTAWNSHKIETLNVLNPAVFWELYMPLCIFYEFEFIIKMLNGLDWTKLITGPNPFLWYYCCPTITINYLFVTYSTFGAHSFTSFANDS